MKPSYSNLLPLVISGPSGVGKSTLISLLFKSYPNNFQFSVSCTTRSARTGEINGKDYYFISRTDFQTRVQNSEFIEHCQVHDNFYGTCRSEVESIKKAGKIPLLDIDVQGALKISSSGLQFNGLFIRPADLKTLELRLRARKTDSEESIQKRLKNAEKELNTSESNPEIFKHVLVNNDLSRTSAEFMNLVAGLYPHLNTERL